MKIIIAPAKVMKTKQVNIETTDILFKDKTTQLHNYLMKFNLDQLHDIMKISFKMADTVYSYFHNEYTAVPALYCYQGTVFKQLSLKDYDADDFVYLEQYLNILSAYYGILKYNSAITPYRLDMIMKIDFNLYQFWQDEIDNYFKNEDYIISLASKEFTKMLSHPHIINIDFVEDKAGKMVRNSMYVKQARGKMLDLMVKNKISDLDSLKRLTFDGYIYHEEYQQTIIMFTLEMENKHIKSYNKNRWRAIYFYLFKYSSKKFIILSISSSVPILILKY